MSELLTPEQAQAMLRRLAANETLSEDDARALDQYRAEVAIAWRELQEKMDGVTEDEILEALARDGTITIDSRPDLRPPAKLPSRDRNRRPKAARLH